MRAKWMQHRSSNLFFLQSRLFFFHNRGPFVSSSASRLFGADMHPAPQTMRIQGSAPLASSSTIPCLPQLHQYKTVHQHAPSSSRLHYRCAYSSLAASLPTGRQSHCGLSSTFSRTRGREPSPSHSRGGAAVLLGFLRRSFEGSGRSVFWIRAVSPVVSLLGGSVSDRGCLYRAGGGAFCRLLDFDSSSSRLHCADQRRYTAGISRSHHQLVAGPCASAEERRRMRSRGAGTSERCSRNSSPKRTAAVAEDGEISIVPLTDLEKEKFKEVAIEQTNKVLTVPTILTLARIAAIPALLAVFYSNNSWATATGAGIFVMAAVTDWLDGYLARKVGASSAFGAFLDPVADKLMVAATLVLLCTKPLAIADFATIPWLIPLPTIAIIGREITMSAVREWAATQSGDLHKAVAVNNLGKIKTASQMVAITLLLASGEGGLDSWFAGVLGIGLLYVATILALWSLTMYMKGIWGSMFK